MVIGMNGDGRIDVCNYKMADFLGLKEKEVLGQYFWKVQKLIENYEALEIFNLLLDDGNRENTEFELNIQNSKHYFILDSYELRDDGFMNGKIIALRDITDRRAMEEKLRELSLTDELTRLYNRRYFDSKFQEEIIRSERYHHPLSLIMLDLDHFKRVNDTYGHLIGDEVLRRVSDTIASSVRRTDICARLGGEELGVLLPETSAAEAYEVAERLLHHISALEIPTEEGMLQVTASIGVTTRSDNFEIAEMIAETDQALYSAKENGRNQVRIAGVVKTDATGHVADVV